MEELKRIIEEKGKVLSDQVLKTDTFLNHAIDPALMDAIGRDFAGHFRDAGITKVVTIESGGIAPALATAMHLGVPMVFVKKAHPVTMNHPLTAMVHSFTKNRDYELCMESGLIEAGDNVLFIDDFLANGDAFKGILTLLDQAQAHLAGAGICIGKSWQRGRKTIHDQGIPLYVLAPIRSMSEEGIVWDEN
ncbi:xanthine phosphoribosyltransferase [Faecalibaculum rodentium]|uniref:xanthine phosphoribosyltransferase n=1 Tax=Faecalibaculum rodentium TaxID=1702221 RepID=UPI0023F45177|nr:xanthine phosphoribosyltransferase [Faecalibaculum rodentium]